MGYGRFALFQLVAIALIAPRIFAALPSGAQPTGTPHILTITFGVFRPPYVFEKKDVGIDVEVAAAIFHEMGRTFRSNHSPNQRAWKEFELGRIDGMVGVSPDVDRPETYFSQPMLFYDNVAISKKKSKIRLERVSDLRELRFLSFEKAQRYLGPEYEEVMRSVKRDTDVSSQLTQNKLFWSGKVDVIILDLHVFQHYRQQLKGEMKTDDEVVIHRIFPAKANSRCVVFRDRAVRDEFNKGLLKIKANGTYQKILDKYLKAEPKQL